VWSVVVAELVSVFVEGDVADPVQRVFDARVSLGPASHQLRRCMLCRGRADRVDNLDVLVALDDSSSPDLQDLARAGPVNPRRDDDGLDLTCTGRA